MQTIALYVVLVNNQPQHIVFYSNSPLTRALNCGLFRVADSVTIQRFRLNDSFQSSCLFLVKICRGSRVVRNSPSPFPALRMSAGKCETRTHHYSGQLPKNSAIVEKAHTNLRKKADTLRIGNFSSLRSSNQRL